MFDPSVDEQLRFHGYGPSPLPNALDDEVDAFLDTLFVGGPTEVADILSIATLQSRRTLAAYAERMASLAVRRADPELVLRGVVAIVMGGLDENERECLMTMAPLEDAATRVGVELADVVAAAAKIVGAPGAANLAQWLARTPEKRSLACMRFVAGEDADGFRYKQEWLR